MNVISKLKYVLLLGCISSVAHSATVINNWSYINEAGFANATTGTEVTVDGAQTTLDPNTLSPLASTGKAIPTANGNQWIYNPEDNLYYDLGTNGSFGGSSHTGDSADSIGKSIGTSIFEPGIPTGALYDEICWGNGPSCLKFSDGNGSDTSRVEGVAVANSFGAYNWNQGTTMEHSNLPTGSPSLTSIDILDGLKLYSDELLSGELPLIALGIDVIFNETYANAGNLWDYAPDDAFIVTLDPLLASITSFGADFIDFTVTLDLSADVALGYHTEYEIITRLSGLDVVSTPFGNTFGIITPEGGTNVLDAKFAIRAINVSEPAYIAFLGLALLGVASFRNNKRL